MIRWLVIIFLVLMVFSSLLPWLERLGIGRLPGDVRFSLFWQEVFFTICVDYFDFFVCGVDF